MATKRDRFVSYMRTACLTWSLGYDQSNRWDVRDGGECDCSSLVYSALWHAGYLERPSGNLYAYTLYTGSLRAHLVSAGWKVLAPDIAAARAGDILLNDGRHVAAVIEGGGRSAKVAQASIDERGAARGGASGDQGDETNVRGIYTYSKGWSCILRPPAEGAATASAPARAKASDRLDVDGWVGYLTVAKWQSQLGAKATGKVEGQHPGNRAALPALTSADWTGKGSALVKAVQRKVGLKGPDIDGIMGKRTVRAVQAWLAKKGHSCGPGGADGILGRDTGRAIQRSLNAGAWR